MSRGNDAVPTWSGFNYQGKMMLLHVLELMNKIQNTDAYIVELEKNEDFSIKHSSEYKSFHQVKACLSKNKWSAFEDAMKKLLQHKKDVASVNSAAKCYLTVARKIDDWNDDTNIYKSKVLLYKRSSKVVGVCEVRGEIEKEISDYLKNNNYSDKNKEVVYAALCLFLDDKIAKMHRQGKQNRNYDIYFSEIAKIIESAVNKQKIREEFYLKEKVYEYITQNIGNALEQFCYDKCEKSVVNCDEECAAKIGYEEMMQIVDYSKFCKVLNPDKIEGWDNSLSMVEYFSNDKIQNEIYELLYKSKTPGKVAGNDSGIFLKTKYSNANKKQVLPTFLSLERGRENEMALQRIFQNIIDNKEVIDILSGNSITVIPGNYSGILSQAQITSGWQKISEDKINECYKDIELISSKELKDKFTQNGGNHD